MSSSLGRPDQARVNHAGGSGWTPCTCVRGKCHLPLALKHALDKCHVLDPT